jgi:phosphoserine phosphatase RsbU/P
LDGFELAGACLSAREVGGDFYDWHSPSPGLLTLTIADVMGKGMPAALLMATVRAAMRAVVRESAPSEAMRYVGRTLNDDLSASDRFVTLFLGQLDLAARHLAYVDAGHGFAFLRRSDGSVEQLGPRGLPLGIPVEEGYEEHSVGFGAGDALILYSDGLLDARPDIGLDYHALAAHLDGAASAAEMVGRLTALAACAAPLPDDLTVVVLRCTED